MNSHGSTQHHGGLGKRVRLRVCAVPEEKQTPLLCCHTTRYEDEIPSIGLDRMVGWRHNGERKDADVLSPQHQRVRLEHFVMSEDGEGFRDGLGDEQAVEGVHLPAERSGHLAPGQYQPFSLTLR